MIKALRLVEVLRYQLGILGMLGLLGLVGCALMAISLVLPAQKALQQQTAELAWLKLQPVSDVVVQTPKLNDEQALQKFYQQFPPVSELSKVLSQIHQLAVEKGINLAVGEYKLAPDVNNPLLMRYEIIFPVQANYKNLRDFISAASVKFPTLGLSEVNVKRESVKETVVQIKLNYVLLLSRVQ